MPNDLRSIVAWTSWPSLMALCIATTYAGFALGEPMIAFYVADAALMAALLLLQQWLPHEVSWLENDGQFPANIGHTVVSTAAVQSMLAVSGVVGLSAGAAALSDSYHGIWPAGWPLPVQIILGLVVMEFPLYWAHRIAHEWKALWQFHAVHHCVVKLTVINSGRFHFIDAIKSVLPSILLLIALGAPTGVLIWLSALGAYIGLLTHANVAMRFGPLSRVFNTPELHWWHHSKDPSEGNKNYGENLMIWDWVFGSWFNVSRRPPSDIGVHEPVPERFVQQIFWPFQRLFWGAHQSAGALDRAKDLNI